MPQRNVATNFTFEQQRAEINLLAQDFWTQKGTVDTAASTYLKHDGTNNFTGATLAVPNAFTINSNSGNGTVTIAGNLQVDGTTTTVNTATMDVVDKNITIAKGSANDAAADGAGITIDSATDITFNFVDAKDALVSSIGLEATTFLKGPYGQFTGSGTPSAGQGLELNAPDANTGQIISYDRGNSAYKDLRIKGTGIDFYAGSTNAIVGGFHNTGLIMQSGKGITCPGNLDVDGNSTFGANGSITSGGNFTLNGNGFVVTGSQTAVGEFKGATIPTVQITQTTDNTDLQLRANADGGLVRTATNKPLILGTNQQTRLTITSEGYLKLAGTIANSNNKLGRFLMPSHDSGEEDVMYMQFQQEDTYNQLEFGGGSSSYNAATQILFRTAAIDTVTGVERLRIASDGTVSKYHNATDIAAAFGGGGQVNGVTALPSMVGTPFVVAKDTGSGRSATFAGVVQTGSIISTGLLTIQGSNGNAAHTQLKLINTDQTSSGETGQTNDIEFHFTDNTGNSYKGAKISAYKQNDWVGNVDYDAGFKLSTVDNASAFGDAYVERLRIQANGQSLFNPHSGGETNADTVVTIRGWAADDNTSVNEAFKNAPLKIRKTVSATDLNGGIIDAWDDGVHAIGLAMNYGGSSGTDAGYHLVFGVNNDTNDRPTEKFRISGNGRAGLGVANPTVAGGYHGMEIGGSANSGLRLSVTSNGGWAFTDYNINGTAAYIVGCKGGADALSPSSSWRICSGTSFDSNQLFVVNNNGSVLPGSDNTQDFGSSSFRWANVYTGDMHLNNMHSGGNEVDGTEGHWTMQEGSDDLFLINRNTGKKYKFNLTEV